MYVRLRCVCVCVCVFICVIVEMSVPNSSNANFAANNNKKAQTIIRAKKTHLKSTPCSVSCEMCACCSKGVRERTKCKKKKEKKIRRRKVNLPKALSRASERARVRETTNI